MFDIVIITHIPCFYKVNLFNEVAKKKNIMVLFIGNNTIHYRSADFISENIRFKHQFINEVAFENRNMWSSLNKLRSFLALYKSKSVIVNGWELPEFWLACFLKKRVGLILESSVESSLNSRVSFLKKFFLKKISFVIASGTQHVELLKKLDYRGEVRISHGVGIINKLKIVRNKRRYSYKYLYLGRISTEKNLDLLFDVFNKLGEPYTLDVYGTGRLENSLEASGSQNIRIHEPIDNKRIGDLFNEFDFLVLPSTIEPWGLVVEEALFYNTPVIISRQCGVSDMVKNGENGYLFDALDSGSLKNILSQIDSGSFEKLAQRMDSNFINEKDILQVDCYY